MGRRGWLAGAGLGRQTETVRRCHLRPHKLDMAAQALQSHPLQSPSSLPMQPAATQQQQRQQLSVLTLGCDIPLDGALQLLVVDIRVGPAAGSLAQQALAKLRQAA